MKEKSDVIDKIKYELGKYKYVVPMIAVGLVLVLWPSSSREDRTSNVLAENTAKQEPVKSDLSEMEEQLAEILSAADGVGRTLVFLSPGSEGVTTYAEHSSSSYQQTAGDASEIDRSDEKTVVTIRDADGNELPIAKTHTYPTYRGALIVCEGGDEPKIRLAVTQALSSLLGIGTDAIQVMKMK